MTPTINSKLNKQTPPNFKMNTISNEKIPTSSSCNGSKTRIILTSQKEGRDSFSIAKANGIGHLKPEVIITKEKFSANKGEKVNSRTRRPLPESLPRKLSLNEEDAGKSKPPSQTKESIARKQYKYSNVGKLTQFSEPKNNWSNSVKNRKGST